MIHIISLRLACVRGVVVDSKGMPMYHPVEPHMVLHARLCIGSCIVSNGGTVLQPNGPSSTTDDVNSDESCGMWST